jgi:hypothetical protein
MQGKEECEIKILIGLHFLENPKEITEGSRI